MKGRPMNRGAEGRSLHIFFLLVFLFSIPFWVVGPLAERFLPEALSTNLPISALMACAPVIAAVVLVRRDKGTGAGKALLKRAFDYERIGSKAWYVPIFLLMPAMMILQYGWMKLMGMPLAEPQVPALMIPVSFAVFFVAALGEEVGWQGYTIETLQDRWSALTASIIVGIIWPVWHIIPFIQMNRTPTWIVWHCMGMIMARILYVWIYNGTGKSVFAVILFHAMHNVSTILLPSYGWPYDPLLALIILAGIVAIVLFLWGPSTLARYRYARPGKGAPVGVVNSPVSEMNPRS